MVIRGAQGNNLGEVLTDGINILAGEFTEGINGAVNGFKQFFGKGGIGNFAPNGQQTNHNTSHIQDPNDNISTSEVFKDNIRRQKLASERNMQAKEVDFFGGSEDERVITKDKFGSA